MKWVTRENAKVDRVACPWLIRRFIDQAPQFLFVPREQVLEAARREGAHSFDAEGAEFGHRGERCTFEAFVEDYQLKDEALQNLALIVHGADIPQDAHVAAESAGLLFPVYDALYAYCQGLS